MKTKLPAEIKTIKEAEKLLTDLYRNGESYHPEDDANKLSGDPFTMKEGKLLNKLMGDIYMLPGNDGRHGEPLAFDPCEFLLDIMKENMRFFWKDLSGRGFTATLTWLDIKHIFATQYEKDYYALMDATPEDERGNIDPSLREWAYGADPGEEWSDNANHYTCIKGE